MRITFFWCVLLGVPTHASSSQPTLREFAICSFVRSVPHALSSNQPDQTSQGVSDADLLLAHGQAMSLERIYLVYILLLVAYNDFSWPRQCSNQAHISGLSCFSGFSYLQNRLNKRIKFLTKLAYKYSLTCRLGLASKSGIFSSKKRPMPCNEELVWYKMIQIISSKEVWEQLSLTKK